MCYAIFDCNKLICSLSFFFIDCALLSPIFEIIWSKNHFFNIIFYKNTFFIFIETRQTLFVYGYIVLSMTFAGVVELVDTQDLGSCDENRGGSSPATAHQI